MLPGNVCYHNVQLPADAPDTLLYTVLINRSTNMLGPFKVIQHSGAAEFVDLNPASAARVQTSPLVIGGIVGGSSVGTTGASLISLLLELPLVLLDILGLALTLLVELLVLSLDLGIAMFGLGAAAASTGRGS